MPLNFWTIICAFNDIYSALLVKHLLKGIFILQISEKKFILNAKKKIAPKKSSFLGGETVCMGSLVRAKIETSDCKLKYIYLSTLPAR